jgi:hypothetical protein
VRGGYKDMQEEKEGELLRGTIYKKIREKITKYVGYIKN